jgi:hypothetical protein
MRKVDGLGTIGRVETQALAVAPAALGGAQLAHQPLPVPALVDGQQPGQSQAQGVKGGRAELALEDAGRSKAARARSRTGAASDRTRPYPTGRRWKAGLRRLPAVARATGAPGPGRGMARRGQRSGSCGRMASQRNSSTKLGINKRRWAAGMCGWRRVPLGKSWPGCGRGCWVLRPTGTHRRRGDPQSVFIAGPPPASSAAS